MLPPPSTAGTVAIAAAAAATTTSTAASSSSASTFLLPGALDDSDEEGEGEGEEQQPIQHPSGEPTPVHAVHPTATTHHVHSGFLQLSAGDDDDDDEEEDEVVNAECLNNDRPHNRVQPSSSMMPAYESGARSHAAAAVLSTPIPAAAAAMPDSHDGHLLDSSRCSSPDLLAYSRGPLPPLRNKRGSNATDNAGDGEAAYLGGGYHSGGSAAYSRPPLGGSDNRYSDSYLSSNSADPNDHDQACGGHAYGYEEDEHHQYQQNDDDDDDVVVMAPVAHVPPAKPEAVAVVERTRKIPLQITTNTTTTAAATATTGPINGNLGAAAGSSAHVHPAAQASATDKGQRLPVAAMTTTVAPPPCGHYPQLALRPGGAGQVVANPPAVPTLLPTLLPTPYHSCQPCPHCPSRQSNAVRHHWHLLLPVQAYHRQRRGSAATTPLAPKQKSDMRMTTTTKAKAMSISAWCACRRTPRTKT